MVPFIAAALVLLKARDSGFNIGTLGGLPLVWVAGAVMAACVIHHALNWRCPVCRKNFWTGIFVSYCKNCGTVFEEPKLPPGSSPVAERQAELERATELEVGEHAHRYVMRFTHGLAILVLGLFTAFFLSGSPEAVAPDGWLAQKVGAEGAPRVMWALGALVGLIGLAMIGSALRNLYTLRQYKKESMELLNSEEIQRKIRDQQGG